MARFAPAKGIYDIAARFKTTCLQADGSLLFEGGRLWTLENLKELHRVFVDTKDTSKRAFMAKFHDQLADSKKDVKRLAAEVLLVHFLFPSSVTGATKRRLVSTVLSWAGDLADDKHPAMAALDRGVGSGGQGYNSRRPNELWFLINFALKLKSMDNPVHTTLFSNAGAFRDLVDDVEDAGSRQFRHMLLHLIYPDDFERIASSTHKRRIAWAFRDLAGPGLDDLDDKILSIRRSLEKELPGHTLDFYQPPLAAAWNPDDDDEPGASDALLYKKQIVLYGPPGTGKTHQAKALAATLIRSAALQKLGAAWYFQNERAVQQVIGTHFHRVQLHPGYSYEDFIRGLHVGEGGKTEYRLGLLPKLVQEIEDERRVGDPVAMLPHVLLLDEMNRADLSRLLGECFSLLEDRGTAIPLPGLDGQGKALTLKLPDDLYVIGTMNLIDQSIEQVDFALRRRFLWQRCGFNRQALVEVCKQRWNDHPMKGYDWDTVGKDFERLGAAAAALNAAIHKSKVLGEEYEIGHTYFFDVVSFLQEELAGTKRKRTFLWKSGKPESPVSRLWSLSLKPLLHEYLRGLEPVPRAQELGRLEEAFLAILADVDE
ncbi:AAA family ATPase [Sorangium sp. So ce204]|uniref:AAA family ATPase n=1 Tax=Sorangium sp. So ce204 TaxID=3133288 RepID=UPI003F608456